MITPNPQEATSIPEPTKWIPKCSKFGLDISYVPTIDKYFINSWEIKPVFPIIVLTIMITSYVLISVEYFSSLPFASTTMFLIITIFFFLFIISYLATILEGPGYLPFFYPSRIQTAVEGQTDYLSGLVVDDTQKRYMMQQVYPQRTHFMKSARRIVIRPDHFCDWVSSFIGKRNHKLFFLFNLYGVLYISLFLFYDCRMIFWKATAEQFSAWIAVDVTYAVFALIFAVFCLMFTLGLLGEISSNQTDFEEMTRQNFATPGMSCVKNWEEIFGSSQEWWTWPIPIPSFYGVEDSALVRQPISHENVPLL